MKKTINIIICLLIFLAPMEADANADVPGISFVASRAGV